MEENRYIFNGNILYPKIEKSYWGRGAFLAQEKEGQWVTISGTHVFIKEGETADDAFKRTTGKDLEKPPTTKVTRGGVTVKHIKDVGGTKIWAAGEDDERIRSSVDKVTKVYEKLPESERNLIKHIEIIEGGGEEIIAGGNKFKSGAHYEKNTGTIRVFSVRRGEINLMVNHEVGHAVWDDIGGKSGLADMRMDFRKIGYAEGGVSDYSKAWLKEGVDSENFAEAYSMYNSGGWRTNLKRFNPKTYQVFKNLMGAYHG